MKDGLANQRRCPKTPPSNQRALECVASFITEETCQNGGGEWVNVTTHFIEKVLSQSDGACAGKFQTIRGVDYEPHEIVQMGSDKAEKELVAADLPEVIYAPSTVVNHNGVNMDGKFSSYTWKIPFFPSNTIQRCVLRIR